MHRTITKTDMNKLTNSTPKNAVKSSIDRNKNIALNQSPSPTPFPVGIGQMLEAYFAQYKDAVDALRHEVLQNQQPVPAVADSEKLLTATQAAEMLSLCRQTVFDYAKRGLLISYRLGGRTYFKQGEVVAAMQSQQQPTGRRKQPRKTR